MSAATRSMTRKDWGPLLELERAKLHGPDVRTIDALKEAIERAEAAERDFLQVHQNCIEARAARSSTGTRISFNLSQARQLLQMFGGDDSDITVEWATGHSGMGMYAHYTEYLEEGAELLDPTRAMPEPDHADAMERAAAHTEWWATPGNLELKAGEMTAQELRTVKAVLRGLAASIRVLAPTAPPSATAASEKPTVFVAPSHCEARLAYSPTTGGVSCYACNAFSEYQPYPADRAKLVCKRTGEVVAVKPYSEYVK